MRDIAKFQAVLAEGRQALQVSDEGAGRLKLDMDESQLPEVLKCIAFGKGHLLTITVGVEG